MKDYQKRCQPNGAESVMAKLMHLDELRPHQSCHEKHRVLSSSYIHKSASIGLHRGRLVSTRRSESNNKHDIILDKSVKKCQHNTMRDPLRYLQKLEQDSFDYTNKSLKLELDTIYKPRLFSTGINAFKRKSEEVRYDLEDAKSQRHSCIVCSRAMNRIPESKTHKSKFEEFYRKGYMGENYANNSKNSLMKRTISEKDILHPKDEMALEQFQTSFGVNDIISLSSKTSEISCSSCVRSEYNNSEAYVDGNLEKRDDRFRDDELSQRNSKTFISNVSAQYVNDDDAYASEEAFGVEALLNELSEEGSAYSNCSRIGTPEFQNKLKRTNQHSPDSVLEPFDLQSSSTFESFDCIGLRLQLQALNYEREETYSEESIMLVSDDDESEKQFDDLPQDGRNLKRWLGDVESRNFSYMVDVLDEAGYCGVKSFLNFKGWHSLEFPISLSVFEELEKKYSKQASWQKSERKLLFDCINSGLKGIFDFDACATSVKRRVCEGLRRDEVEDEIWVMLVNQEKEKNKDLSHKAIGKWSEYEEGMNMICREIETSLFDELVMELA